MATSIILGLIYVLILILSFIRRDWPAVAKKMLLFGHAVFAGLLVVDIILALTSALSFRGVHTDRVIFWGLFITGGLCFPLFKRQRLLTKIYFGVYLYYPVIAATTYLFDKIMFVIVASPILFSLLLPETYYKDNKFEIRENTGLMAPRRIILIEKKWLTEKQIGQQDLVNKEDTEITGFEIISTTPHSITARLDYGQRSDSVTFVKIGR
jgi:hypothetical protein